MFRVSSRGGSGLHQYWQTGAVMVAARAQVYLDQASTEWDESEVELEMTDNVKLDGNSGCYSTMTGDAVLPIDESQMYLRSNV